MSKAELSLGDSLRIGSAVVPAPHSMAIECCGIGMIYKAHGVRSVDCNTINLLYAGVVDKVWPCPWCANDDAPVDGLSGASVIRHPFGEHYLTGQISIEDLASWLDYIAIDPNWKEMQTRIETMPKFSSAPARISCDGRHRQNDVESEKMGAFGRRGLGAATVAA